MKRSLPRSQRQYVHVHNAPAQRRARALKAARGLPMPDFIEPALATLRPKAPKGANWVHEVKYDGNSCQASIREGQVRFCTRRGYDWTARLAKLAGYGE